MNQIRMQFNGGPKDGSTEPLKCDAPRTIQALDAEGRPDLQGLYHFRGNDSTLATANYRWAETRSH